jgi:hypothetical protein
MALRQRRRWTALPRIPSLFLFTNSFVSSTVGPVRWLPDNGATRWALRLAGNDITGYSKHDETTKKYKGTKDDLDIG